MLKKLKRLIIYGLLVFGLTLGFFTIASHWRGVFSFGNEQVIENWVRYYDPQGTFSVAFPKDPELNLNKTLTIPSKNKELPYNEFKSTVNESHYYSVTYVILPKLWLAAGSKKILTVAFDSLMKNMDGVKVIEQKQTLVGKIRVLDFQYQKGEETVEGRMLLIGNKLFKLSVVHPSTIVKQDIPSEAFLNSFRVG